MPKYKIVATGPVELVPAAMFFRSWISPIEPNTRLVSVADVPFEEIPSLSGRTGLGRGKSRVAVQPELTMDDFEVIIIR